ncbi:hypothetical protein KEJ32_04090 [Candidatus Bathyarchaeota archaeon]|nr:hypothetical protein [Candidatus Bathyarchaeota archaeon]
MHFSFCQAWILGAATLAAGVVYFCLLKGLKNITVLENHGFGKILIGFPFLANIRQHILFHNLRNFRIVARVISYV